MSEHKNSDEVIEKSYEDGMNYAWEMAKRIVTIEGRGGLSMGELNRIFGTTLLSEIFTKFTSSEAAEKIKEWDEENKQIKVGDVVLYGGNEDMQGIVTNVSIGDTIYVMWDDGSCGMFPIEFFTKTGRTVNIHTMLEKINGGRTE